MKFRIIFMLAFIAASLQSFAQNDIKSPGTLKATVMVDYFNPGMGVSDRNLSYVDYLRNKVVEGLSNSKRVNIFEAEDNIDLRSFDARGGYAAPDLRKRYEIMKNLNIDYVIECDVRTINAVPNRSNPGRWDAQTAYNLRLIDVQTGNTVSKFKYEVIDNPYTAETPDKAITGSFYYMVPRMNVFILDNFRIEGQILEVVSLKKDIEVKEVTINVGPENAARKGSKFEVHKVNGTQVGAKIGEVKIDEIRGDQLSLAKVLKGGKEIKTAIDAGETLMILSDKSSFWDGF